MTTTENLANMEARWARLRRERMAARAAGNTTEVDELSKEMRDLDARMQTAR